MILPPGIEPIAGQSNIQMPLGTANRRIQEMQLAPTNLKALGVDAVLETGVLRMRVGYQQGQRFVGKYVAVWGKGDGEWKLESFMRNRTGCANPGQGCARQGGQGGAGGQRGGQGAGGGQSGVAEAGADRPLRTEGAGRSGRRSRRPRRRPRRRPWRSGRSLWSSG